MRCTCRFPLSHTVRCSHELVRSTDSTSTAAGRLTPKPPRSWTPDRSAASASPSRTPITRARARLSDCRPGHHFNETAVIGEHEQTGRVDVQLPSGLPTHSPQLGWESLARQ
eukprot:scaffold31815_cov118-Isochrysis_galbana.AAC.18